MNRDKGEVTITADDSLRNLKKQNQNAVTVAAVNNVLPPADYLEKGWRAWRLQGLLGRMRSGASGNLNDNCILSSAPVVQNGWISVSCYVKGLLAMTGFLQL